MVSTTPTFQILSILQSDPFRRFSVSDLQSHLQESSILATQSLPDINKAMVNLYEGTEKRGYWRGEFQSGRGVSSGEVVVSLWGLMGYTYILRNVIVVLHQYCLIRCLFCDIHQRLGGSSLGNRARQLAEPAGL